MRIFTNKIEHANLHFLHHLYFHCVFRFCAKLFQKVYDFFCHMVKPKYSAVSDVYAFMFACDLVTFLIVVFGYSSFGPTVCTALFLFYLPVYLLCLLCLCRAR